MRHSAYIFYDCPEMLEPSYNYVDDSRKAEALASDALDEALEFPECDIDLQSFIHTRLQSQKISGSVLIFLATIGLAEMTDKLEDMGTRRPILSVVRQLKKLGYLAEELALDIEKNHRGTR